MKIHQVFQLSAAASAESSTGHSTIKLSTKHFPVQIFLSFPFHRYGFACSVWRTWIIIMWSGTWKKRNKKQAGNLREKNVGIVNIYAYLGCGWVCRKRWWETENSHGASVGPAQLSQWLLSTDCTILHLFALLDYFVVLLHHRLLTVCDD